MKKKIFFLFQAVQYSNHVSNVKFVLQTMMQNQQHTPDGLRVKSATTLREIW